MTYKFVYFFSQFQSISIASSMHPDVCIRIEPADFVRPARSITSKTSDRPKAIWEIGMLLQMFFLITSWQLR